MTSPVKISGYQAMLLVIGTIIPTTIMFLPGKMYQVAKQDSWLSVILVSLLGLYVAIVMYAIQRRFTGYTVLEASRFVFGSVVSKIVCLAYLAYFVHINAIILREFSSMIATMFMPETPMNAFSICIIIAVLYAVSNGLEVLARSTEIFMPIILILVFAISILNINNIEVSRLSPVLADGMAPIIKGAIPGAVFMTETVVLGILLPFLNKRQLALKVSFTAVIIVMLIQLLMTVTSITVIGSRLARYQYALLGLSRVISVADFIERVEPFVMITWVFGGLVKIGVFVFCSTVAAAKFLGVRESTLIAAACGFVSLYLSTSLWGNSRELSETIFASIIPYYLSLEVVFPSFLLLSAVILGRRRDKPIDG